MRVSGAWLLGAMRSPRRAALALAAIAASLALAGPARAATVIALTNDDRLLRLDSSAPGTPLASVPVSGLASGDQLVAIDVRPVDGRLYGLGSESRLYLINAATGAATQLGAGPFSPVLVGTAFGFDVNAREDVIRVVSDTGQNLRVNPVPAPGVIVSIDLPLNPGTPRVVASAFTSSFSGAVATTLYGIDSGTDQLVRQDPPNAGTLVPVGPLGVDTSDLAGFDIDPNGGGAYASLTTPGAAASGLFRVNLATGAATPIGNIGGGAAVRDIALLSHAVTVYGVTGTNQLVRISSAVPGTIRAVAPIGGLLPGEAVMALDVRPNDGGLYGVGLRGVAPAVTGRLLRIDPATAAAAPVGADFALAASTTGVGLDFDPTTDRAAVLSDGRDNLRLNPDTGAATPLTPLAGASPAVVAAAYTNSVAGATATTLYGIDDAADTLVTISSDGVVGTVGPLGVDVGAGSGLDMASADGTMLASLVVGGTSGLYLVDRTTGTASLVGAIGGSAPVRGIAIAPPGRPGFSAATLSVQENAGGGVVAVNRLEGSDGPLSVDFSATAGTATAGADFAPMSTTITFLAGETSKVVRVPILDDTLVEGEETVTLTLTNSTGGSLGTPSSAVLRIVSEEAPPTPTGPTPTGPVPTGPTPTGPTTSPATCPGVRAAGRHVVRGTAGNDRLRGTRGADVICGLGGNDVILGLGGNDLLLGGAGRDTIDGGSGRDRLRGDAGADTLRGGSGDDVLLGGAGADRLIGGLGLDLLDGGPGADRLEAIDTLLDRLRGGTGIDRGSADLIDRSSEVERLIHPRAAKPAKP
ncbi:MAG: hypothetical protein QOK40_640 [Miltoncostaeaceae bacterium]|nr:hypothetical protein [Miltoncostaeaceae bacterium]